ELAPESQFCVLVGDPERLQQVVWNLLSNAVKFTDEGGKIRISVRHDGANMTLSVSDTGRGIDAAFLPYVFDRFKQADGSTTRRMGGLGLGLAIVRHIVELHGGRAAVASEGLGLGSTFSMTLPIAAVIPENVDRSVRTTSRDLAATQAGALQGLRILLIDDDDDARDLISLVLSDAGAVVEAAGSAAEGFESFRARAPDVLVSDIGMPEEDGYSFIRRVRALPANTGGNVPAIALSAFASDRDRQHAITAGFTAHIAKPVDPEALVSIVASVAESGRP
ncbi:MAG: ATP-binding protein, partial [Polyangiaceae bacterium]